MHADMETTQGTNSNCALDDSGSGTMRLQSVRRHRAEQEYRRIFEMEPLAGTLLFLDHYTQSEILERAIETGVPMTHSAQGLKWDTLCVCFGNLEYRPVRPMYRYQSGEENPGRGGRPSS